MAADILSHLTAAAYDKPSRPCGDNPAWGGHIPFAFWAIEQWRPQTLVELGTHAGSSYFAFCQSVQAHGTDTQCYAVDTWQGDPHAGSYGDEVFADVDGYNRQHYSAFSHLLRMRFDDALGQFADGSIDLLHIDGFHTYDAVRHDFETWLPKMSRRGVVLFHDSNVFKNNFGVWRLMCELEPRFPHFHFLHSHGLSMFTLSEEAPAEARWMTALSLAERKLWRRQFEQLGKRILIDALPEGKKRLPFHPWRLLRAQMRRSRALRRYSLRSNER